MKLVVASDTHGLHAGLDVPDGDIFIHAGDFTMEGELNEVAAFGSWIRALPHRQKIVIAGNHEFCFERESKRALRLLGDGRDGLIYLQDSGTTVEGLSFWGSPWQPWFFDWAFNLRRGPELAAKWALIPDTIDVLITHGPPMGLLDEVRRGHVGCVDLLERVTDVSPKAHIFGHIHEGAGQLVQGATTFVNASICDERCRVAHCIQEINL